LALYITLTCFVLQCLVIYAFDKKELQLVSKDKFPKSDCKCELVGFRCLEELGSEIHFCFENQSAILFQSKWFHVRKLHYWLSFLVDLGPPFRRSAIPGVRHSGGPPRKDAMGNRRLGPL